jgi:signal transduction histidine kinase
VSTEKEENGPLARIERAVADIEVLIDTFLLLAREDRAISVDGACDLGTIVGDVVEAHRHLLASKAVDVGIDTGESGTLHAPPAVVSIAVANLVRNAFQHTTAGSVDICAQADRVCVVDTGPGLGPSSGVAGLGLTIVKRLCERMGWTFTIADGRAGGTRAELVFRQGS